MGAAVKTYLIPVLPALLAVVFSAQSQGTFVYDQQSATESLVSESATAIQTNQPLGQSFTPSLSSVGFIRLNLWDQNPNNGLGATVYVNLLADSITGPIIGSSALVWMPNGFGWGTNAYVNFYFTTPVTVTPGMTYYLNPVVQSGDVWDAGAGGFGFNGGTFYIKGVADPHGASLWFREGIVVPEPSALPLVVLGASALIYVRRRHIAKRRG
jgi:hypothetical protein